MTVKDKLPVSYLLFTNKGRINRLTYWTASVFIWTAFYILFNLLEFSISYTATLVLYPLLFWALIATATKRLHDINYSGKLIGIILIPVLGPLALFFLLGFKKSNVDKNRFGHNPNFAPDYFKNEYTNKIQPLKSDERIINDVTQLNPVVVSKIEIPDSIEALRDIIKNTNNPISIGGGKFSMGGQTASSNTVHIDMRKLNKIIDFSANERTIKVETGVRWCDIQKYIDPYNLSVKTMQTYANFTVGGSLSVNCHGRYIGLGALILSVKSIDIILENGDLKHASREENTDLFFASIGCYNAIGVIAAATFDLEENIAVERINTLMKCENYLDFFFNKVRENKDVIFHNGDIYPPAFKKIRGVSWVKTEKKPTEKNRLMPLEASYPLERYFIGAFSKSKFGKWRRQYIYDPILFYKTKVHWRNYEAGYDVAELEPESRKHSTYVLQEYFAPVKRFDEFTNLMSEIFNRHHVNVINVSIRHAHKDDGSLLAWAREEVFAFVVWYKQNTDDIEKNKVGIWTRELIDAAISVNGSYYLPYQVHATDKQFHQAYPKAKELMELKSKIDPNYKFRNVIWDTYYQPKQNQHEQ
ncbi:FAD-binding protein [Flavobacterium sp.]|uniref:FAD-binding protein n=1 Tax=Flavobacterium sp. TaxID=239 RepID=UPI003D6A321C